MRKTSFSRLVSGLAALLLSLGGCAGGYTMAVPDTTARPAQDAPDRFLEGSYDDDTTRAPQPDPACHSPMTDPRDGTRLRLARSAGGRGDYETPEDRYGVGPEELLRLDCTTGAVVGIVPRKARRSNR